MNKGYGIIGHFGGGQEFLDGQTIKTLSITEALERGFNVQSMKVDTFEYLKHPFRLLNSIIKCLKKCDYIFLIVSSNGRRVLIPLLTRLNKLYKKKIYHCLIGGRLADEVEHNPKMIKMLNSMETNWVESHSLAEKLIQIGVINAQYLPNFKLINPICSSNRKFSECPPYRLCTFSRVVKMKGISDAIVAVRNINKKFGYEYCKLDIYGQIASEYSDEFSKLIEESSSVQYCGSIESNNSVEVLSKYDVLLFPTLWYKEGIPGTIVDALFSATPVVASKWAFYDEMLIDGVTGYGYQHGKQELLAETILKSLSGEVSLQKLGMGCMARAYLYSEDHALHIISECLGEDLFNYGDF